MSSLRTSWRGVCLRLLREPVVHFLALGTAIFLVHRLIVGAPDTVKITPGLEAELTRRFQDLNGRVPDASEREQALVQWTREEALFRQALREHLDRDDPTIRTVLVDKMYARAALEVPKREPTEAELRAWQSSHRELYETPLRYDFEFFTFPTAKPGAANELEKAQRVLAAGAGPAAVARPLFGGKMSVADMVGQVEPELVERIPELPRGQWTTVTGEACLFLARIKNVEGGLPSVDELRPRLVSDWSVATRKEAVERVLQRTIERYRFEPQR